MSYISREEVKDLLEVKTNVSNKLIDRLIPWSEGIIFSFTGRSFNNEGVSTRYLEGSGRQVLSLPDIHTVTRIETRVSFSSPYVEVDEDIYSLEPSTKPKSSPFTWVVLYNSLWPGSPRAVKITGEWGWTEVPLEIKEICGTLIARQMRAGRRGFADFTGSPETGLVRVSSTIPKDIMQILKSYRAINIESI